MFGLNPTELIIILAVVLLLFGSTRLPKLARSLGEASKEFKDGIKEDDVPSHSAMDKPDDAPLGETPAEPSPNQRTGGPEL